MITLKLPTTATTLLHEIVRPTLDLMPDKYRGARVDVMLLAIAGQESGLRQRRQLLGKMALGKGRGLWQMEPRTAGLVYDNWTDVGLIQKKLGLRYVDWPHWLESDDRAGCMLARGDLWCNPEPLPNVDDDQAAWDYYIETWRPGKPRPTDWAANYQAALDAIA